MLFHFVQWYFYFFLFWAFLTRLDACNEKVLGSIPRSCMNRDECNESFTSIRWQWFHKCSSFLIGVLRIIIFIFGLWWVDRCFMSDEVVWGWDQRSREALAFFIMCVQVLRSRWPCMRSVWVVFTWRWTEIIDSLQLLEKSYRWKLQGFYVKTTSYLL